MPNDRDRPIATDLLTPLGAYLRLRGSRARAARSCSSRSSAAGSAATRSSAAARGSSRFDEAETLGEPVVGYLGYDAVAAARADRAAAGRRARTSPESLFVVPDVLVRFDHARGVAEVLVGDAGRGGAPARRPAAGAAARRRARAARCAASPTATSTCAASSARRSTSARATSSRSCSRSAPSGRPPRRRSSSTARSAASTRRRTSSCSSSTTSRSSAARRRRSSSARARAPTLNPIAGTIAPGEGDAEALLSSEKDRAEHVMLVDLGRNDLSRVCVPGIGARRAVPGARALLARDASRLGGRRRAARRRHAVRAAARELPRRHRLRRAEGARDADHLRARGPPARHLRGRRRLRLPGRAASSTRASRSARSCCATASRTCRRAAASSPTPTRRPSTRSA